ncbi:hypothetical protein [Microlunatus parietis]|uniref:PAS domain-containing protein n=1 Tax=Microlunatus parietis TaxID=682979 RepID=A0A7Y9LBT7_9ACTN|nr:hypothetical protein [Microlunatus parietis]NYE72092.1 PAS domain-containing protein [Microlunatus parietis]
MNQYGARALEHWRRYAPDRVAELESPEAFFTDLGAEIAGQVSELAARLENNPALMLEMTRSSEQTYLHDAARRMTARRIAEEVVMNQLAWVHDPSLPLEQAREEWEQTRPADENLIVWAERTQDAPYPVHSSAELEEKATEWALPVEFLEGLLAAEIPRQYMEAHADVLAEAATIRFLREVR